ncbi:MAG TPA: hypothetical protein VH741_12685 [Candidatus Limnocylindrales bacterium]
MLALMLAACSYAAPQRTPPVGSLPDPAVLLGAGELAAVFGGTPTGPACHYSEAQYRCTWTDAGNPERELAVTIWADPASAEAAIGGAGPQPLTLPGASAAASTIDDGKVVVWTVVNQRGLAVSWSPDDPGNEAAHLLAASGVAGALTTILAP